MSPASDPPAGTPLPPEASGSLPARRPRAALPSVQGPDGPAETGASEGSQESWFTPRGRSGPEADYPAPGGYSADANETASYPSPGGNSGGAANGFGGQQPRGNGGQRPAESGGWQQPPPSPGGQQPGSFGGFPGQAPGGFGSSGPGSGGHRTPEPQGGSGPHRSPGQQTPPPAQTPPWVQGSQGYPGQQGDYPAQSPYGPGPAGAGQQAPGRPGDYPLRQRPADYPPPGDYPTRNDFPAQTAGPQPSFQPAQPNGFGGAQPGNFPPSGPRAYPAPPANQPTMTFSDPAQQAGPQGQWQGGYQDQQYGGYPGYQQQQGMPPGYPPQDGYPGYQQQQGAYPGYPQDASRGPLAGPGGRGPGRGKLSRKKGVIIGGAAVIAALAASGAVLAPKLLGTTDPGCKTYTGTGLTAYNKTIDDLNSQVPQSKLTADMNQAITQLKTAVGQAQSSTVKSALNGLLSQLTAVSGDMKHGAVPAGTVTKLNAAASSADNAC